MNFDKIKQIIADWFTAKNGSDYSLSKLIAFNATWAMIVEFFVMHSEAYLQLGLGISVIIAALAGKYFVESPTAVPAPTIDKDA
jgi:hypothetical protein